MTKIDLTLDLEDPHAFVAQIRRTSPGWSEAASSTPSAAALRLLADAVEAQVPKPIPCEPTGDVVVFILGKPYWPREGGVHWVTYDHSNNPPTWEELIDGVDRDDGIQIYRRDEHNPLLQQVRDLLFRSPSGSLTHEEAAIAYKALRKGLSGILTDPQSDGAGALPTSPSPEVGVATSPPASSPEEPQEFGSVVRASSVRYEEQNWTPIPRTGEHWWHSETGKLEMWRDLIDPEVLRIGVGTDEKAKADESVAYSNGYEKGAADRTARILLRLQALRAVAITAPEQDQFDKAIRECR